MRYVALRAAFAAIALSADIPATNRPSIVLVMADDQGWGQVGYYSHPILKTPNIDAMAQAGLQFNRFYAGAPNCSPTRTTVMTGRSNDRTGGYSHGFPLRRLQTGRARSPAKDVVLAIPEYRPFLDMQKARRNSKRRDQ